MAVKNYLLDTIYHLRTQEELVYYGITPSYSKAELQTVVDFLEEEYEKEKWHYPFIPPDFDAEAAEWAALLLFRAGLLFVNRDDSMATVRKLLSPFVNSTPSVEEQLSADVSLRFLPVIYNELKALDYQDPILPLLEEILQQFHYSSIAIDFELKNSIAENELTNPCYKQMYVDRILQYKARKRAAQPLLEQAVMAAMGNHKNIFWNNL
jgi:hypothetical protein